MQYAIRVTRGGGISPHGHVFTPASALMRRGDEITRYPSREVAEVYAEQYRVAHAASPGYTDKWYTVEELPNAR